MPHRTPQSRAADLTCCGVNTAAPEEAAALWRFQKRVRTGQTKTTFVNGFSWSKSVGQTLAKWHRESSKSCYQLWNPQHEPMLYLFAPFVLSLHHLAWNWIPFQGLSNLTMIFVNRPNPCAHLDGFCFSSWAQPPCSLVPWQAKSVIRSGQRRFSCKSRLSRTCEHQARSLPTFHQVTMLSCCHVTIWTSCCQSVRSAMHGVHSQTQWVVWNRSNIEVHKRCASPRRNSFPSYIRARLLGCFAMSNGQTSLDCKSILLSMYTVCRCSVWVGEFVRCVAAKCFALTRIHCALSLFILLLISSKAFT